MTKNKIYIKPPNAQRYPQKKKGEKVYALLSSWQTMVVKKPARKPYGPWWLKHEHHHFKRKHVFARQLHYIDDEEM